MGRVRLIVKQIAIQKRGEVNFFQVRLPKNAEKIIGVETDVFMQSAIEPDQPSAGSAGGIRPDGTTGGVEINRTPFMKWRNTTNPVVGKLKLQSLDRNNIFFDTWIRFVFISGSIPDMSVGQFPKSPYSVIVPGKPKTLSLSSASNILNGFFTDNIGLRRNLDTRYIVKVFVWIRTTEKNNGVIYDFENSKEDKES